jgi:hypothetical protein
MSQPKSTAARWMPLALPTLLLVLAPAPAVAQAIGEPLLVQPFADVLAPDWDSAAQLPLAQPPESEPILPPPGEPLETSPDDAVAPNFDESFSPLAPADFAPARPLMTLGEWLLGGPSNGRHRLAGQPLVRESWLNRPWHIGAFVGGQTLSDPISGLVHGGEGFLMGFRFGWDAGHFFGGETRIAFGGASLEDPNGFGELDSANLFFWDVACLYYPWGDTRWRPYVRLGLGLADYDFMDGQNRRVHDTLFDFPVGIGLKYRHSPQMAFRIELLDNISTGSGVQDGTHNISLTAGAELHFGSGGARKGYWPWNPSRGWW